MGTSLVTKLETSATTTASPNSATHHNYSLDIFLLPTSDLFTLVVEMK